MAGKKNRQDRKRSGVADDIMGISHGGGRDQYGGSFGGGQSGGGAYANPHTSHGGGEGGNRYGAERGNDRTTGGQTNQGYYGGGQMGDQKFDKDVHGHNAASKASGPEQGHHTYQDHPSQDGADVDDVQAVQAARAGFDEHKGFGKEHTGQAAQGREHGGPHLDPDPEPGRRS